MAEDWSVNVKKYDPGADDGIIAGIVRYCGIALHKRDSQLVSFGDDAETGRVRENFLKKKLGLTHSDDVLNADIAAVGSMMKGENFKNRVTVYYLLARHYGLLHLFAKAGTDGATPVAAVAAGTVAAAAAVSAPAASAPAVEAPKADVSVAPLAAVGAAGAAVTGAVGGAVDAASSGVSKVGVAALGAAGVAAAAVGSVASGAADVVSDGAAKVGSVAAAAAAPLTGSYDDDDNKGGWGWWPWLLLGLLALGLLWWLFGRAKEPEAVVAAPVEAVATTEPAAAPTPTETAVTIPEGAGVTSETVDGKPLVKVYFDTNKTNVVPAFAPAAAAVKAYLDSHADAKLEVSGFNDPRGNAAANAALSKGRAENVQADLVKAGIAADRIALVEPASATDSSASLAGARRVEVVIK